MGFVLSIFYLITVFLGAGTVFGPLAPYRIELILAVLIFFVSLPALSRSFVLKTPQSLALLGLAIAGFLSVLLAVHWAMGAVQAFLSFLPSTYAYFLMCLHCNTKKRIQIVVLMLMAVCLFVTANGFVELAQLPRGSIWAGSQARDLGEDVTTLPDASLTPYLFPMRNGSGDLFYRLEGHGFFDDPNDFGQLVVCVIPLVFIFWRTKRTFANLLCVILPVGLLLFGIYLTHSRGALVALIAVAIVAARRRIGTLPALLLAGALFAAATALQFSGGREISATAGADRTALWGDGLQLLRTHPIFGIGLGQFENYTDSHLTAHNSVVLCAAELGLTGLFFWSLFLFSSVRDSLVAASPTKVTEGMPPEPDKGAYPQRMRKVEQLDKSDISLMGQSLVTSFTGFLVAGMFLSKSFVITLFLLGGMAEAVYQMALRRSMIVPRMLYARVLGYSGLLAITLVLMMYIIVRVANLMH
jgi:hypothetical protein